METLQPIWETKASLGDANSLDYGGAFLLVDQTGVYNSMLVMWDAPTVNGGDDVCLDSDPEDVALDRGWERYSRIDGNGSGETIFLKRLPDGLAKVVEDCDGWEELCEYEGIQWEWQYCVYRFSVERLYRVEHEGHIYYVTKNIKEGFDSGTLPHPISAYKRWYLDLIEPDDLAGLLSEDVLENARATLSLAEYHGYENFDSYPLEFGKRELEEWASRHLPGAKLS